jgi:L,D-transpeptidase catalytic domain
MQHKLFILCVALIFATCTYKSETKAGYAKKPPPAVVNKETDRINKHAAELAAYALKNNCNSSIGFLFDMKKTSGQNRFYVYDFRKNKVIQKGLVTHGNCGEAFLTENRYGNTVGCNCTSLGKYKVGKKYYGKFGLAYKLHGLESTNNKAFERFVVLHAHSCVPDDEVKPYPICQSNGCPTVSPNFLETLSTYIDNSKKPVLLWIYE